MFCRHCGNKLDDSAKVCPACGTEVIVLNDNKPQAEVKPAQPPKPEQPPKPVQPSKPAAPVKKRAIRHVDPSQRYNRNQPSMGPMQIKAESDAMPSVGAAKPAAEKPTEKPAAPKPAHAPDVKKEEPKPAPALGKNDTPKHPELDQVIDNAGDMKPAASPFESLNQPKEKTEPQKNPELGKILENSDNIKPAASPFESLNQPKEKSEPQKNPELGKILENSDNIKPAASPFESLNQPKEKSEPKKNPELGKILENSDNIKPAASPFESLNQPKEKSEPQKNPELGKILENADNIKPAASPFESLNQPKEKSEPQKNPELGKILENSDNIKPAASPFESLNQPKEKSEPQKNPELGKILENSDNIKPAASPFESLNQPKEKSEPQKNPELDKILENAGDIKPAASPFPSLNEPGADQAEKKPETIQPETVQSDAVRPKSPETAPEPEKVSEPVKNDRFPEPVKVSEIDEIIDSFGSSSAHTDAAPESTGTGKEPDDIIDNINPSIVAPSTEAAPETESEPAPEPDQYASVRPAPQRLERLDTPTAPQRSSAEDNPFHRTPPPPPVPSTQSSSASAKPVKKKGGKKGIIIGAAAAAVVLGGVGTGYFGFHNDITRMTMGDKEYARMISRQAIKDIIPADGTSDRFAGYALNGLTGLGTAGEASLPDLVTKTGALSNIFDVVPAGKALTLEASLKVKLGESASIDSESAQKVAETLGNTKITAKLVNGDTDMISVGINAPDGKSGSADIYCKGSDIVVAFPGITDKTVKFTKDELGGAPASFDRGSFKKFCSDAAKIFFDSFESAEMSFGKGVEQTQDFTCGKTELSAKTSGSEIKVTFTAAQVSTMLGKIKDLLAASPDAANTLNGCFMMFGMNVNEALDTLADGSTTLTARHLTDVHNNILATCISFDRADGTTVAELRNTKQDGLEISGLSYKDVSVGFAKKVRVGSDGNAYITIKSGSSDTAFEIEYTGSKKKEFLGSDVLVGKYIIKPAEGSTIAANMKGTPSVAIIGGSDLPAELDNLTLTYESTVTGSTHTVSFDISAGNIGSFGFTVKADVKSESAAMPDTSAAISGKDSKAASGIIEEAMAWLAGEAAEVDGGNGVVSNLVDYDPNKRFIEHYSAYDENSRDKATEYAEAISANLAEHISAAIAADSEASGTIKMYFINGKCMVIDPAGINGIDLDHLGLSSVYAQAYYDGTVSDTITGVTVVLTDSAGDLPSGLPDLRDFTYGVYPWGGGSYTGVIDNFVIGTCPILPDGEAPADVIDNDGDGEPDTDTEIDEPGTDTDGDGDVDENDVPVTTAPAVVTTKPVTTKTPEETTVTKPDTGSSTDFGAIKKNPDIGDVVGVWQGKNATYAICSNYIMTPYSDGTLSNTDFMVLKSTKNGFDLYEKGKTKTGSLSYSAKTDSIKLEINGKETILAKKKSGTKMSYMGNWTLYTYEGLTSSQYCKEYDDTADGFAMNLSIGEFSAVITTSRKSEIYTLGKVKSGTCRLTYNSWTYFDVKYDGSGKLTLTQHYSDSSDTQEFVFIKGSYKF